MKAIILAAGRGSRLGIHANDLPKCLLEIGELTILDNQLKSLQSMGIKDVVPVLGYKKQKVLEHLAAYPDLNFKVLENVDYESTNTAYSLWLARNEMSEDFLYLNGDVFFHHEIIRRLFNSHLKNVLAVVRKPTAEEEVKVILDGPKITAIGKTIAKEEAYGEFTGLARFSKKCGPLLADALEDVISNEGGKQQYFEAALERLLPLGSLAAIDVSDLPCIEIDFPEDLNEAVLNILPEIKPAKAIKKQKILFYVERNLHLPFLEPIHDYMAEHFDVELAFSSPPLKIAQAGRTGQGLSKAEVDRLKSKSRFYANPSDYQADAAVVADACYYAVRHCNKIVNVGHGLISKGWFYTDKPPVRRENRADLICVPGMRHKEILRKNVFSPVMATGFIKSDAIYACKQSDKERFYQKYNMPSQNKMVLFAPTFNDELSAVPYVREQIGELGDDNTTVLIKLHGMTEKKWFNMYKDLAKKNKDVFLIEDCDFAAAMACADVMVSDVSSAYAEFMLLDKPVVLFNSPEQKNYYLFDPGDIEHQIRDAGIQVESVNEMKLAVKLSLADPGQYSRQRKSYAAELNYKFDGKCAERAAKSILCMLNLNNKVKKDNVLFSIIVQSQDTHSYEEIVATIDALKAKNPAGDYEIILVGPRPVQIQPGLLPPMVKEWIDDVDSCGSALARAINNTQGDFIVLLKAGTALPDDWLKWMSYYFRWYPEAGAVKAFSNRENYKEILRNASPAHKVTSLKEIADYFLHVLMGNEVRSERIETDNECIMIAKNAYERAGGFSTPANTSDPVNEFGQRLINNGFTLWNAVEVFAYQQERTNQENSISGLLERAIKYKKENIYPKAIALLEKAKSLNAENTDKDKTKQVLSLLQKSRHFKKIKDYRNSIDLLEEAKQKIA